MQKILIVLCLITGLNAHAGILGNSLFIEPYIGYKTENIKLTDLLNNETTVKSAVPSLGLKFGYRSMMGIDINLAGEIAQGQADVSTLAEKNKFSHTMVGFQLGVNSLGYVKMYLGASFLNDYTLDESTSLQKVTLSGPSYQAGLVLKLLSYLNLGVQYNLNQYTNVKGNAYTLGDKLETYFSKTDTQDYSFYLSTSF